MMQTDDELVSAESAIEPNRPEFDKLEARIESRQTLEIKFSEFDPAKSVRVGLSELESWKSIP